MRTVTTLAELNDLAGAGELKGLVRVSNELYHEGPGVSSTGLKELLKSPAHYAAYKEDGSEDSAAKRFGRLVHLLLLEPEKLEELCYLANTCPHPPNRPDHLAGLDRRNKAVKDWEATWSQQYKLDLEAWNKKAEGKDIPTTSDSEMLGKIRLSYLSNSTAKRIFTGGQEEVSVYWTDEASGVLCKARADYLRGSTIFDLKTCYSAAEAEFKKAVKAYRYDLSAAFYLDGFRTAVPEVKNFAWVALEKTAPHCFGFYAAVEEDLNAARAEISKALATYAECQKSGVWPGLPETFTNLSLTGT